MCVCVCVCVRACVCVRVVKLHPYMQACMLYHSENMALQMWLEDYSMVTVTCMMDACHDTELLRRRRIPHHSGRG